MSRSRVIRKTSTTSVVHVTKDKDIWAVIEKIAQLPADWHRAGSVSAKALRAIARHAEHIGPVNNSVESGCGKTTLLFSHLSANHLVFSVDGFARSISLTKQSPLLNPNNVTIIEGPSQETLPSYTFTSKVAIALIDGPHGYPSPDLEYYYFHQLIETGGLLIIDDIRIPSIRRMFDIVNADDMFDLLEIVDNNMAIFRRSEAPLTYLNNDSWWAQGYNRAHYAEMVAAERKRAQLRSMLHHLAGVTPVRLKMLLPRSVKKIFWRRM